jgi:2-polyprenyl-3-methyl-5-hydroxy-6-metoxy-1,4-benzoquinol methylase
VVRSDNAGVTGSWSWDESLYAGSAAYYSAGRMPYPAALAARIADEVGLTGTELAIDVGCGPGSLTILLARYVAHIIGIDADREMIDHAVSAAARGQVTNASWRRMLAEDLPADLGSVDLVTFAQSFHWMDRPLVADRVRAMLTDGGSCVHVHATTHRGDSSSDRLQHPRPPYDEIDQLVR